MRSDKDKRTETEREIDDFLSQFDSPSDESSTDYSSYLDESESARLAAGQTFLWKDVSMKEPVKKAESKEAVNHVNSSDASPDKSSDASSEVSSDAQKLVEEAIGAALAERVLNKEHRSKHAKSDVSIEQDVQNIRNKSAAQARPVVQYRPDDRDEHVKQDLREEPAVRGKHDAQRTSATQDTIAVQDKRDSRPEPAASGKHDVQRTTQVLDKAEADSAASPSESEVRPELKINKKLREKNLNEKIHQSTSKFKKIVRRALPAAAASPASVSEAESADGEAAPKPRAKRDLREVLFLKENPDYDPLLGDTIVKDGKTIKNKKYYVSFKKLLLDFAAVCLVFVMAGLIYATVCIVRAPSYDYTDVYSAVATSSIIYDDKEKQVDNVFYTENRKVVKYEDMPQDLINSFIAIEDKTFWKHHGFNWTRMIGAVFSSLAGNGRISGTSTITQQLSRNVYLADTKSERSIKRKILEMYYAARLEYALSKEQIIEAYLNTIYLGHGCYGVNAAAKTYFSKKVKDLDLIECASLAALPQSPDTYALLKLSSEAQNVKDSKVIATDPDTIVTNDISKDRRQLTLDLMLEQGYITQSQHDAIYDMSVNDFIDPSLSSNTNLYSYFHEYLVDTVINDLMKELDLEYADAERMVYTKGLQIYSTVDSKAQKTIAKEFQDGSNFPYVTAPRDADGNLLNNDGKIALYKYENFFDENGNFRLSGADGDVKVNSDGSFTIMKDHKLHIYETEIAEGTDYSLEFKNYYVYDENDILYSIQGGYLNIPYTYKTADGSGNITVSADYFTDPSYEGAINKEGEDVVITERAYTLSPKTRQPQGAMTIVKVGTGEVKAMVGGRQFSGQKMLNRSLNARQPGSSIKPLTVYGAALQKSFDLAAEGKKWKFTNFGIDQQGTKGWGDYATTYSSIEDERTRIEGKYWPNNVTRSFSGKNTFRTAVQRSINTCAVKLQLQVGADYSIEQLKKFGITTVQDDTSLSVNDANPAALALGAMTDGVMPLEMALAYASFPGGGKVNTPICYTKVLDREGNTILEGKSEQTEALDAGVAWIMTDVLKSVVRVNGYMYVTDVQPGGKTGTTNDQYDIWFDGFTPSYAASLWIGTDENVEMSSMSTTAAALWGKIINQLPKAKKGDYASQPSNVIRKAGEYFTKGTETGLTSWSAKEAREKAKKAAYKKWLKEREKHKKLIKEKGHWEDVYETKTVLVKDAWDETKEVQVDTGQVDENGNPIYKTETQTIHHDAEYKTEKVKTGTKWVVDVKKHYEYEKGYRDGDFKFKG